MHNFRRDKNTSKVSIRSVKTVRGVASTSYPSNFVYGRTEPRTDGRISDEPILNIRGTINENLKIITDSRIRSIILKGPKYRFPAHIDFNKCRETIASALNDYCTRWCKPEHVESNALNNWKLKIFKTIDERVLFYSNNLIFSLLSLNYLFDI